VPSLRPGTPSLGRSSRRTGSTPGPTFGGYPAHRVPPCIWAFLNSLREHLFFRIQVSWRQPTESFLLGHATWPNQRCRMTLMAASGPLCRTRRPSSRRSREPGRGRTAGALPPDETGEPRQVAEPVGRRRRKDTRAACYASVPRREPRLGLRPLAASNSFEDSTSHTLIAPMGILLREEDVE